MAETESNINQVIERKAGGYNLRSVAWWQGLAAADQENLINNNDVQFFASGVEVEARVATEELAGAVASVHRIAVTRAAAAAATAPVIEWPPLGMAPTTSKYTRRVVEGPRWKVTRTDESGEVELHVLRGHEDASAYDLSTAAGARRLSNDLLLDAIGYPAGLDAEHPEAFAYFKEYVFDQHLGNRPWEVTATKLRATFESNPHLKLATPASTSG